MPTPLWLNDAEIIPFPPLTNDIKVDAVIAGGGITGAVTAYLLKTSGLKVAVLEKARCGGGETGHTSAHLSYVPDLRIHQLDRTFGRNAVQAILNAGRAAIDIIEGLTRKLQIDCEFARVPGYLHSEWDQDSLRYGERDELRHDAEIAVECGFPTEYVEEIPISDRPGVMFPDQAVFHPWKFVRGLLDHVVGAGGQVFEESEVEQVDESNTVLCRGRKVQCEHFISATHYPLRGNTSTAQFDWLQTHLASYSTYVVSAEVAGEGFQPALYWDTASPYNYLRFQARDTGLLAILGGEDHKTGQVRNTTEPFARLDRRWSDIIPYTRPGRHWSGQVIETNDGLPMIGELSPRHYIATGFAGNGLTFGTIAAQIIRDRIIQVANPWHELFRPDRSAIRGGVLTYLSENLDYPRYFLQDRLSPGEANSLDEVPIGAGRIVRINGERVAAYRDSESHVKCRSAICTHRGCIVRWNSAERTWDCPCHGSRFLPTGEVMAGPAVSPLEEHVATHSQS